MAKTIIRIVAILIILAVVAWLVVSIYNRSADNDTAATPLLSTTAFNQTQNRDATSAPARPDDIVVFTLNAENQTNEVIPGYVMEASLGDMTNSAVLVDGQGASYNSGTNSLIWTPLDIPADNSIQKQFSVRVNPLPATETSRNLSFKFNNQLDIPVERATVAGAQTPSGPNQYQAPVTGPAGNISLWLALGVTLSYFIFKQKRLGYWG